jgi:C1A family cysteine protease
MPDSPALDAPVRSVHASGSRRAARYGWIPDLPDRRDFVYTAPAPVTAALPPKVDLTAGCPAVYDQGDLGSCTAQAIAAAVEFDQKTQKLEVFVPSRLFIYYNERALEGTIGEDAGAMIRDGIKAVNTLGAPHERLWPYDIGAFRTRPPKPAYTDGARHTALRYERVPRTLDQMKGCLASGFPFVFGFAVYESFESDAVAATGTAPLPAPHERLLGGHAVLAVGYDDAKKRVVARNSWGTGWGARGYFTLPYAYLLDADLSDDFWTIRLVG